MGQHLLDRLELLRQIELCSVGSPEMSTLSQLVSAMTSILAVASTALISEMVGFT